MSTETVAAPAAQGWPKVDAGRSAPAVDDPANGRWVAVCAPDREETQGPEAKALAIRHASQSMGLAGGAAWRRQEGPYADDGRVKPPGVGKQTAPAALEMSVAQYYQLAGAQGVAAAAGNDRFVTFHLVVRAEPLA